MAHILVVDVDVEGKCVEVFCVDLVPDPLSVAHVRLIAPRLLDGSPFRLKDGQQLVADYWTVRRSTILQYMRGLPMAEAPKEMPAPIALVPPLSPSMEPDPPPVVEIGGTPQVTEDTPPSIEEVQ
jgi:hypothetical protein